MPRAQPDRLADSIADPPKMTATQENLLLALEVTNQPAQNDSNGQLAHNPLISLQEHR